LIGTAILMVVALVKLASGPAAADPAASVVPRVFLPVVFSNSVAQIPASPTPTLTSTPSATATPTPSATPASATPTRTSTPQPTVPQVAHTSLYVDSVNYTHVLGEVINYAGSPIYYANVAVTFYNANGTVAGSGTWYTLTTMIQAGERSPFDALMQPQPGWSAYTLTLGYDTTTFLTYSHAFAFSGQNQWSDSFETHYAGTITNVSGQTLQFPQVVMTGYDGAGNVVVAQSTYVGGLTNYTINDGQSGPYEIDVLLSRASLVAQTAFLAEGWH
jgi:hypothetical protein